MKKLDKTIQLAVDLYSWMIKASPNETMKLETPRGVRYFTCTYELPEEKEEDENKG